MKITEYTVKVNIRKKLRIALSADLHNRPADDVIRALKKAGPDLILVCGDLLNARIPGHGIYEEIPGSAQHLKDSEHAAAFLKEAVSIAPVFFSTGNHELYFNEEDRELLRDLGVGFLDDAFTHYGELVIGGLSSPYHVLAGTGKSHTSQESARRWEMIFDSVNLSWLSDFENEPGVKLLMCHHPEFYEKYLKSHKKIDLILAGHTHGGQIRLFGKGLFAYGQGFFPRYSAGFYDGRMIVSSGLANTTRIPRIGNPKELVIVTLVPA